MREVSTTASTTQLRRQRRRFRSTSSATMVAPRARRRARRSLLATSLALAVVLLLLTLRADPVVSLEATFTPNPADSAEEGSAGPLPLSQAQRDQLTQLDRAISSSNDPKAALNKIAESNGMTPEDLGSLLMRNRRDMEAAAGGGGGGGGGGLGSVGKTLPRKLLGTMVSTLVAVGKVGRAHPRTFGWTLVTLLCGLYVLWSAPRNGIVLSTSPKPLFLSSGHTTFLPPPSSYVRSYLDSETFRYAKSSLPLGTKIGSLGRTMDDVLEMDVEEDGEDEEEGRPTVTFYEDDPNVALSVAARRFVPYDDLLPGVDDDQTEKTSSSELARAAASSILRDRRFSEYVPDDRGERVRFYRSRGSSSSSDRGNGRKGRRKKKGEEEESAAIAAKGWGDFGRYGVLPLRLSYETASKETKNDDEEGGGKQSAATAVTYHTLEGGSFDGEIRFSAEETTKDGEERGLVVAVSVVVPKGGRKPNKRRVEELVTLLTSSVVSSIQTQTRQTSSRRGQSKTYQKRATKRAVERRHVRFEAEQKIEEMAEDRWRRWAKRNPDAGRYRPSGRRMRSPNNC